MTWTLSTRSIFFQYLYLIFSPTKKVRRRYSLFEKAPCFFFPCQNPKDLGGLWWQVQDGVSVVGGPWGSHPVGPAAVVRWLIPVGGKVRSRGEQWGAGGEKGVGLSVVNLVGPGVGKNGLELKGFFLDVFQWKKFGLNMYMFVNHVEFLHVDVFFVHVFSQLLLFWGGWLVDIERVVWTHLVSVGSWRGGWGSWRY